MRLAVLWRKTPGYLSPSLRVPRPSLPLKWPSHRRIVNFFARLCLGLVLIVAAVSKSFDLNQFAQRVSDFGLVHDALVTLSASAIVLAELLSGIALILHLRGGLTCSVVLLLLFISVLIYGIALGLDVECGCFGPEVHVSLGTQLLMDFGLLAVCAIIYWSDEQRNRSPFALEGLQDPGTDNSL